MNYFLKRLLLLIPTLWVISIIIFFLARLSPGETAEIQLEKSVTGSSRNLLEVNSQLQLQRSKDGENIPLFYFSIYPSSFSDTLYKIPNSRIRENLKRISYEHGNWETINTFYSLLKKAHKDALPEDLRQLSSFTTTSDLSELTNLLRQSPFAFPQSKHLLKLLEEKSQLKSYIPAFHWYGFDNQYHNWISGIVQWNLGTSLIEGRELSEMIGEAILWTVSLSLVSLFLSLIIALPLSVYAASNPDGLLDKVLSFLFFSIYSIPLFWLATLLLIYFASEQHLHWFPSFGPGEITADMNWMEIMSLRSAHLFLPIVCWTYGSLAFLYRQNRGKMVQILKQDYILTAKAKGLSKKQVLWKHAFKNSQFPLITILGGILPGLIGGSFVIESVFELPGMGRLTIEAFFQRDYPLIFAISLLACFLTLLGAFLADLAYHFTDPRVKYQGDD